MPPDTTGLQVTTRHLRDGIWTLDIVAADAVPHLVVSLAGAPLQGNAARAGTDGHWTMQVELPPSVLSDGVHSLVVTPRDDPATVLDRLTLIAGNAVPHDLLAEMALLRAELDMLKRAFRGHCRDDDAHG